MWFYGHVIYVGLLITQEYDSKLELECELDRTRAADLVKRAEAAVGAAGTEAARQSLRRPAEQRIGQAIVGIAKVGMIKDVEEFGTETKIESLGEMKLALEGKIDLRRAEATKHVAPKITLRPRGGGTPCSDLI